MNINYILFIFIMAESFKTNLDQFLVSLIMKIGDQSQLEEIQKSYDAIMDECNLF